MVDYGGSSGTSSANAFPNLMKSGGLLPNLLRDYSQSKSNKNLDYNIMTLSFFTGQLLPLFAHNRHVFGPYYAEIIQSLLMPNREATASD